MLTTDEFVENVRLAVYRTAIDGVAKLLERPPGRPPASELMAMSDWVHSLGEEDRRRLMQVVRISVDQAVFGFLAVLDGERSISSEPVDLTIQANGRDINPDRDLHERFRSRIDEARAE